MAWTATSKKEEAGTDRVIAITFTDGVRTLTDRTTIQGFTTDKWVAKIAADKIAWLTAQDAAIAALTDGPVDLQLAIDPPPDPPKEPTDQEKAAAQLVADLAALKQLQAKADDLINTVKFTDLPADLATQIADLQAKIKAEYATANPPGDAAAVVIP